MKFANVIVAGVFYASVQSRVLSGQQKKSQDREKRMVIPAESEENTVRLTKNN